MGPPVPGSVLVELMQPATGIETKLGLRTWFFMVFPFFVAAVPFAGLAGR